MTDLHTLCPTIVGRGGVLALLADAVAQARTGRGATIAIVGEAGIGKSRLVAETSARAMSSGLTVVEVGCSELDRTVPYAPLLATLRAAASHGIVPPSERAPGPHEHELAEWMPELAALVPEFGTVPTGDADEERRRFFEALRRVLCRAASRVPMVLTIEDVHWMDDASLRFVTFLAAEVRRHPFLLLLTYRSDELSGDARHALADLERQRLARAVPLARLSRAETAEMLAAMLGHRRRVPGELIETMFSLTDGNPFFVEEIVRSLVATPRRSAADAVLEVSVEGVPIPTTVQDAVARRVGGLLPATRQTLVLAAVAGRQFDFALLAELQGCEEDQLLEQMKELIAAQLVVEVSAEQFAFRHALTRHAIYAELLGRERMALHRRIAEAIERLGAGAPDRHRADLATHYFGAGPGRRHSSMPAWRVSAPRSSTRPGAPSSSTPGRWMLPPGWRWHHPSTCTAPEVGPSTPSASSTEHGLTSSARWSSPERRVMGPTSGARCLISQSCGDPVTSLGAASGVGRPWSWHARWTVPPRWHGPSIESATGMSTSNNRSSDARITRKRWPSSNVWLIAGGSPRHSTCWACASCVAATCGRRLRPTSLRLPRCAKSTTAMPSFCASRCWPFVPEITTSILWRSTPASFLVRSRRGTRHLLWPAGSSGAPGSRSRPPVWLHAWPPGESTSGPFAWLEMPVRSPPRSNTPSGSPLPRPSSGSCSSTCWPFRRPASISSGPWRSLVVPTR